MMMTTTMMTRMKNLALQLLVLVSFGVQQVRMQYNYNAAYGYNYQQQKQYNYNNQQQQQYNSNQQQQQQYNGNNYGNSNNNKYGSNSNGGGSGNSNRQDQNIVLKVCEDSVVAVTMVYITCTSPYTFYYGNGAHRNDVVCDYNDKATVEVQFQVIANIEEENDIYMTMALRDQEGHVLAVTDPGFLCNDYVGASCTNAGSYTFTTKLRLETPENEYATASNFVPQIQMAFSTKPNHGYNLGALNTECQAWDNKRPGYVPWMNDLRPTGARLFWQRNGALFGTCAALTVIVAFVWSQSRRNSALFHLDDQVYGEESSRSMPLVA